MGDRGCLRASEEREGDDSGIRLRDSAVVVRDCREEDGNVKFLSITAVRRELASFNDGFRLKAWRRSEMSSSFLSAAVAGTEGASISSGRAASA